MRNTIAKSKSPPPRISVVMSVFNGEKYLVESITSILKQTFSDFEFIIIDDASEDKSLGVIRRFGRKDKRIIVLTNKKTQGPAISVNLGLKIAQGKYIARMDADDVALPKRLMQQYAFLKMNPDVFWCGTNVIFIDEVGRKYNKTDLPTNPTKVLPKQNFIFQQSSMFRNSKIRYREKFKSSEDYDLVLRLLYQRKKLVNIPAVLTLVRINPTSMTASGNFLLPIFSNIARDFFHQRVKYGKDKYQQFAPQKILAAKNKKDFVLATQESMLILFLKAGMYQKATYHLQSIIKKSKLGFLKWHIYYLFCRIPSFFKIIYRGYKLLAFKF